MTEEELKGLGGWLIFPIIGLFLSVPLLIFSIVLVNELPKFIQYRMFFSFLYGFLWIFVIIALFSIFKKKRYVPKMMILFYITTIVISLIIAFLTKDFSISETAFDIVFGVIWILYFIRSKRVKNTFIK